MATMTLTLIEQDGMVTGFQVTSDPIKRPKGLGNTFTHLPGTIELDFGSDPIKRPEVKITWSEGTESSLKLTAPAPKKVAKPAAKKAGAKAAKKAPAKKAAKKAPAKKSTKKESDPIKRPKGE